MSPSKRNLPAILHDISIIFFSIHVVSRAESLHAYFTQSERKHSDAAINIEVVGEIFDGARVNYSAAI